MTDDELELRLRTWYRAEVGAVEPAPIALHGSVASIPAAIPVRPRLFGGRRTLVLLAAALIAALIVGGVIAVGSGLVRLGPVERAPVPAPSAAAVASPSAHPTPSSRPLPSPSSIPVEAYPPGSRFVAVDQFLLATDTVGWMTTSSGVYRTVDMGASWTQLHPPGWEAGGKTALIDAETMYSVAGVRPTRIDATHDGGGSWTETTLPDPLLDSIAAVAFQSPSKGYVTFRATSGDHDLRVYGTDDGGTTWTGPALGTLPSLPYNMGKLDEPPLGGVLWESNGKLDNKPFDNLLVMSTDGGATWRDRTYPVGTFAPRSAQKGPTAFWLESAGRIVLGVEVQGVADSVWKSGDDARTWQLVDGWSNTMDDMIDLVTPTEWVDVSSDGSQVRSTVDAGQHWRTVTASSPVTLDQVSFASPDVGWGINECRDVIPRDGLCDLGTAPQALYGTVDGGRTWTVIGR